MGRKRRKKKPKSEKSEVVKETSNEITHIPIKGKKISVKKRPSPAKSKETLFKEECLPEGQLAKFIRSKKRQLVQCYKLPTAAYGRGDNRKKYLAMIVDSILEIAKKRNIQITTKDIQFEALPYGSEVYLKGFAYIEGKRGEDRDRTPKYIPPGEEGLYLER